MKNLITLSQIKLQILGSYAHIYLYLIPVFYLKEYRSFFTSLAECIIYTIVSAFAIIAIILFIVMLLTRGVHFQY